MFKLISIKEYEEAWRYIHVPDNFGKPFSRQRWRWTMMMVRIFAGTWHYPEIEPEKEWKIES
jgi:hypothetical protein